MLTDIREQTESRAAPRKDSPKAHAVVLREEFGVDFAFFDAETGQPIPRDEGAIRDQGSGVRDQEGSHLPPGSSSLTPEEVLAVAADGRARISPRAEGGYRVAVLLYQGRRPAFVAVGVLDALARTEADAAREQARLRGWLQAVSDRLRLADHLLAQRRQEEGRGGPASSPWEALLALDQVTRRLRLHKSPEKGQLRILEAAFELVGAQTLVWIPHHPDHPVVAQGDGCPAPDDCRKLAALLAKTPGFEPPGPLFIEDFAAQPGASRFPSLANLLGFQAHDQGPLGWVVALNKKGSAAGARFRKSDAALLTPFVALLEMQARFAHRYQDLKDLLVGLTRSLTTALDAKDSYTFGHSERVARIAVELGRELGLEGEELGDLYLAGLLHDVGKIGIRDTVLLKPGPLTAEEYEHIKQHVTIGYSILADLRQIRNLLPGVLYHHERWDGKGYPDGLAGENIPLLARILAVADAYDAMSNARPYRDAMPCRKVEEILQQGMAVQWDRKVVEAFLKSRHKIHSIRQRGVGDSLRLAIEGTLRSDARPLIRGKDKAGGAED